VNKVISYSNKKVLVTGGAGFIGSHLAEQLAFQGAHVVVLDNLLSGKLTNLKFILPSIEFIKGDVRSYDNCLRAVSGVDTIFHLAAHISVPESTKNPELCFDINIHGTENILEAAANSGVKNFVFSSSAAVYGDRNDFCKEQDELNPQSPYADSKVEGERLCRDYAKVYGMSTVSLRYFNVYGERQNPDSEYSAVIAKFTHMLKRNQPITIFGTGRQTRDFIEVARIVEANILMGIQPEMNGDVFNIATGTSINILDLVDKIKNQLKIQPISINFMPARSGDIMNSRADCSKYKKFTSEISTFGLESNNKTTQISN